jgi:hypothetical protein
VLVHDDAGLAVRTADEALDISSRNDERWCEAEIHRVRGAALAQLGRTREADGAFRDAIARARAQEFPLLELRAATSLARLGADDAWDVVARLCARLAERGDTPDLAEARALLAARPPTAQEA